MEALVYILYHFQSFLVISNLRYLDNKETLRFFFFGGLSMNYVSTFERSRVISYEVSKQVLNFTRGRDHKIADVIFRVTGIF